MGFITETETPAQAMLRRIQTQPPKAKILTFPTVAKRRSITCWNCGHYHENTRRKVCRKCGEFIDR